MAGPAVLTVFRRAARKARFQAPIRFRPRASASGGPGNTTAKSS
ncbi:hypothetical protein ACIQU4_19515 [Streptomyces sp. NPDC090741]